MSASSLSASNRSTNWSRSWSQALHRFKSVGRHELKYLATGDDRRPEISQNNKLVIVQGMGTMHLTMATVSLTLVIQISYLLIPSLNPPSVTSCKPKSSLISRSSARIFHLAILNLGLSKKMCHPNNILVGAHVTVTHIWRPPNR